MIGSWIAVERSLLCGDADPWLLPVHIIQAPTFKLQFCLPKAQGTILTLYPLRSLAELEMSSDNIDLGPDAAYYM